MGFQAHRKTFFNYCFMKKLNTAIFIICISKNQARTTTFENLIFNLKMKIRLKYHIPTINMI